MGWNAYSTVKEDPPEKESWHTEVHPGFDLVPLAVRTEMHLTHTSVRRVVGVIWRKLFPEKGLN